MNKETNKLIPDLRFPEFVNEGEWREKKLGDGLLQNPEYGMNAPAVPFSNKLPTYIRITDISEDGRFLSNEKVSVDREVTENNYLSDGDIVLARTGASVGKSYKYRNEDGRLVFAGFLIRLKPDSNKLNSDFLFQFLATNQYWKWVSFISARSGQPGINATEYSSLPVCLPPNPDEQQKIASCLSSLDEVIAAYSQKYEVLKAHKKGLMQNLFPQEGENVPKYRFPEFVNDREWVQKKLDKVCEINPKAPQLPEQFVYIDLESVENGILLKKKIINSKEAPSRAQRLLNVNDVIFQTVRPYQMNNYYFKNDDDFDYVASTGYAQLRSFESSMYLYQFIHTDRFVSNVLEKCTGSNYPAINSSDLSQISVQMPKSKEQQKIATCLSSLDKLIMAQAEKIEQLKLHKKGLMQGLFPKIND